MKNYKYTELEMVQLFRAGAYPDTEKGRRKYRKFKRQAEKHHTDPATQAVLSRRAERRLKSIARLKPGNIVRVRFPHTYVVYAAKVLYRVGPHRAQVLVVGYCGDYFPRSPLSLPVEGRGTPRLGDTFRIHWEDAKGYAIPLTRLEYAQKRQETCERSWALLEEMWSLGPMHPSVAEDRNRKAWGWAWWGRFGTHIPYRPQLPEDFPAGTYDV